MYNDGRSLEQTMASLPNEWVPKHHAQGLWDEITKNIRKKAKERSQIVIPKDKLETRRLDASDTKR